MHRERVRRIGPLSWRFPMRRKQIALSFALAATAAALGLFSAAPSQAAQCKGFLVCCDTGQCYCCLRPCPIQCP